MLLNFDYNISMDLLLATTSSSFVGREKASAPSCGSSTLPRRYSCSAGFIVEWRGRFGKTPSIIHYTTAAITQLTLIYARRRVREKERDLSYYEMRNIYPKKANFVGKYLRKST